MSKCFAIIIVVLLGIYAVVDFFQSDDEVTSGSDPMNASMNTDDMMKDMQDDMSDAKSDMMMDDMADDQMSKEQETRKLLAELKTIPASEFAVNKMKYERLLEMHPGNERFMSKVDFYSQKLADQQAGY